MVKIELNRQTIYRLINKVLDADTKFNDIRLHIEYVPNALTKLGKYIEIDQFNQLRRQFSKTSGRDNFMLIAKLSSKKNDASDIALLVNKKYNNAITGFGGTGLGGDQLNVTANDIEFVVDAGTVSYALIPFNAD